MGLVFDGVAGRPHAASAAEAALVAAPRPDVLTWATWLQCAARGEPRSRTLLFRDLVRRGIWAAADEPIDRPASGHALAPQMQGWSPYEVALACAAVALLGPFKGATAGQMAWSRAGLHAALRWAAEAPMARTPDGAPMLWACRLVWAATLSPSASGLAREQRARLLHNLVQDPCFDGLPVAWKRSIWNMAAEHHRLCGQVELERHFLSLLAADGGGALGFLARLRMGFRSDVPTALPTALPDAGSAQT